MMALLLAPVILSFVVLAAHVLRMGIFVAALLLLFAPLLLVTGQAWATRFLQVVLVLGSLEWIRSAISLVRLRIAVGEPWTRMVVILAAVSLVTAGSALALQHERFRRAAREG